MTETKISEFYNNAHYARGADMLKFFLMPFAMFVFFGFPTSFGGYIRIFSSFVAPAFYILCGFFVLSPDPEQRTKRISRALKSSFKTFAVLFIVYLVLNVVYLMYIEAYWLPEVLRKRAFFDFFVLNVWPSVFPVGGSIWFIQSLFYAYVFFFIANKIKLLRFYIPLMIIFCLIMLFSGEFSALIGFPYFGYNYIPGGAVTRAIPYMLVGMFLRNNADRLLTFKRWVYIIMFVAGIGLAYLELYLLGRFNILRYTAHFIGLGVMAFSVCCFFLSNPEIKETLFTAHGRNYARRIYAMCPVVALIASLLLNSIFPKYIGYLTEYRSFIVYFICLGIAFLIGLVKYVIAFQKELDARE